ncbi:MAG: hypothetical protein WKF70_07505 [Chitinophagaceae bacterium]
MERAYRTGGTLSQVLHKYYSAFILIFPGRRKINRQELAIA